MSSKMGYYWLEITGWEEKEKLLSVRIPVFVDEQQVPIEEEIDEFDPLSIHVLISDKLNKPVATGRLKPNGWIGRMAVLKEARGLGLGSAILKKLVRIAAENEIKEVWLSAQTHAIPFYEKHGFVVMGEEYPDAGIPHIDMKRSL